MKYQCKKQILVRKTPRFKISDNDINHVEKLLNAHRRTMAERDIKNKYHEACKVMEEKFNK